MKYYIKLENENQYDPVIILNEVECSEEFITDFEYKLKSLDHDSVERGTARPEFIIKGKIIPEIFKQLTMISDWSFKKKELYMFMTIACIDTSSGQPVICRKFDFDSVFCVDYGEKYNGEERSFELIMAQSPLGLKREVVTG